MLFLPAAALCCLCSALVAMAAQLIQDDLTLTRRVGQTVSFSCGTGECDYDNVFWYQKKETEKFIVILDINRSNGNVDKRYNHPQKDDFKAEKKPNGCELQIEKVKVDHSASYYCSCWIRGSGGNDYEIFGSGTKLIVTDEQVVKPVVSVYPAASRDHLEGKSSLLCVASQMVPRRIQFSWKRQKQNGPLEELSPAEGEQLQLEESGHSVSIRKVDRVSLNTYKYSCSVKHEGGTVEVQTEQGDEGLVTAFGGDSCEDHVSEVTPAPETGGQDWHRHRLLCMMYTVLIAKGVVYCCGLSLLRILRTKVLCSGSSTNNIEDDF